MIISNYCLALPLKMIKRDKKYKNWYTITNDNWEEIDKVGNFVNFMVPTNME